MIVIDDNNYRSFINPVVNGQKMHCSSKGVWSGEGYKSFLESDIPLIPESEWQDRIRQLERDRARMPDLANGMGMRIRSQKSTNYCWSFGTCRSIEYSYLISGKNLHISPASVAAPIKNFRNVGGWGDQALAYTRENGFNLHSEWPETAIDRRYYTPANRELAKQRQSLEYYYLTPGRGGWKELVSCILNGIAVAVGYNWWSHLVCATWLELNYNLGIDNSWGENWSQGGRGLLSGSRKYPDGAVAIVVSEAL